MRRRFVVDTNVLVSALLSERGTAGRAFARVLSLGDPLASIDTLAEAKEVLMRPKFERYVTADERSRFLASLVARVELVETTVQVSACRDPKDDKFLTLALAGGAEALVSGDADLLVLHPFRGIPILTPADFLSQTQQAA